MGQHRIMHDITVAAGHNLGPPDFGAEGIKTDVIILGTGSDISMKFNGTYLECSPTTGMWANCPSLADPNFSATAYMLFDDFMQFDTTTTTGEWVVTEDDAAATQILRGVGGTVLLTCRSGVDDDGQQIVHVGEAFKLAPGKHLWFEARIQASVADDSDIYCGLINGSEDLTGVADNMAQDGIIIHKDDGSTTVKFASSKNGTNDEVANIGTLTTGWHTVGFYVNGLTSITPYFDGTAGTAVSTTLCDDEALTPIFGVRNGSANKTCTLEIDYVKVVQLR